MADRGRDCGDGSGKGERLVYGVLTLVDDVIVLTALDGDDLHASPFPLGTFRLDVAGDDPHLTREGLSGIAQDRNPSATAEMWLSVGTDTDATVLELNWVGNASAVEASLAEMNALREVRGVEMRIPDEVLVARAEHEYRNLAGRVVMVDRAYCYEGESDGDWVEFDEPVAMRIEPFSESVLKNDVNRWTDHGQIDPVYPLSPLEDHPALRGKRVSWTDATSYSAKGVIEHAGFRIASREIRARYADAEALDTESLAGANASSPWFRP